MPAERVEKQDHEEVVSQAPVEASGEVRAHVMVRMIMASIRAIVCILVGAGHIERVVLRRVAGPVVLDGPKHGVVELAEEQGDPECCEDCV